MAERYLNPTTKEVVELVNGEWVPVEPEVAARYGSASFDIAKGMTEAGIAAATGAVATPVAGLVGLAASPFVGTNTAADYTRGIQESLTYSPQSDVANKMIGAAAAPFEKLAGAADAVGDFTLRHSDSPALAALARTLVEGSPDLLSLGLLGRFRVRGPKLNKDVEMLLNEGVPVTRQQAGSAVAGKASQGSEAVLGPSKKFSANQAGRFNEAVLRKGGFDGTKLNVEDLSRLNKQVGDVYNDLTGRVPTKVDTTLLDDLQRIEDAAEGALGPEQLAPIRKTIERIREKGFAAGEIDGKAAQLMRQSVNTMKKDPMKANFPDQLRDALDDAFERGAAPADVAAMKEARRQYRILAQLEKAMANVETGNLSPSKLYNVVDDKMNRGSGLLELARAGKRVLPSKLGDSGTPGRLAGIGMLASAVNPGTWPAVAGMATAALAARRMNQMPIQLDVSAGSRASAGAIAAQGSGEAMLMEQRRRIDEYLRAIGAR